MKPRALPWILLSTAAGLSILIAGCSGASPATDEQKRLARERQESSMAANASPSPQARSGETGAASPSPAPSPSPNRSTGNATAYRVTWSNRFTTETSVEVWRETGPGQVAGKECQSLREVATYQHRYDMQQPWKFAKAPAKERTCTSQEGNRIRLHAREGAPTDPKVAELDPEAAFTHVYNPPMPMVDLPLDVGKEWAWSGKIGQNNSSGKWKVVSRAVLNTEAGNRSTYEIEFALQKGEMKQAGDQKITRREWREPGGDLVRWEETTTDARGNAISTKGALVPEPAAPPPEPVLCSQNCRLNLAIGPDTAAAGIQGVAPQCDGKRVAFKIDDCRGATLGDCALGGGECAAVFPSPTSRFSTSPCIDINGDGDFLDSDESGFFCKWPETGAGPSATPPPERCTEWETRCIGNAVHTCQNGRWTIRSQEDVCAFPLFCNPNSRACVCCRS